MKKLFCIFALGLTLSLLTVGCSKKTDQSGGSKGGSDGVTVVDVWCWEAEEYQQVLFDEFNKTHPNIKIHNTLVERADMPTKIQTTLASGGQMPDVVWIEINVRGKLLSLDCWENLTKAPYNLDKSMLFESMLPLATTPKGELVGLDAAPVMSGIGYKRDLAKEYFGTDDPDEIQALFSTWDDFIVKGKEVLQKSGGKVYMFPGLSDLLRMFLGQSNVPYVVGDKLNLEEALGYTFDQLLKFKASGVVDGLADSSPAYNSSITDKTHIFYPMPEWGPSWIVKINDPKMVNTWGIFTPPGGSYPYGGTAWAIPKGAAHKEAAWEWIKWSLLGGPNDPGPLVRRDKADIFSSNKALYDPDLKFYSKAEPYFGGQDVLLYLTTVLAPTTSPTRQVFEYDSEINDSITLAVTKLISTTAPISSAELVKMVEDDLLQRVPSLKR